MLAVRELFPNRYFDSPIPARNLVCQRCGKHFEAHIATGVKKLYCGSTATTSGCAYIIAKQKRRGYCLLTERPPELEKNESYRS